MADERGFSTRAIHTVHYHGGGKGQPIAFPLFQSSSFAFETAEDQESVATGKEPGYAYSRSSNPTTDALEQTIANLEGAEAATSFASGIGAVAAAILAVVESGQHILATEQIYGGTYGLLTRTLPRFNISHTFADATDLAAFERAIRPETKLIWAETISNPTTSVLDIRALAEMAHAHGALLAVDSTFTSPYLARPLEDGADLVAHSATKYIGGHGDAMGGIVATNREWTSRIRQVRALTGGLLAPFEAYLLHRGIRTLPVRVRAQQATAAELAERLATHPMVERVFYPGLPGQDPQGLIGRQIEGPGALIALDVAGGYDAAAKFIEGLRLFTHAVSLGGVDSLAQHPASLTHRPVAPSARPGGGIVRLSIGLEHVDDLTADVTAALDRLREPVGASASA